MNKKHLRFDSFKQHECGVKEHPQDIMEKLGIKYKHAIPQSVLDQWWFIDCQYDCELPSYITEMIFNEEDYKLWNLKLYGYCSEE